jgi:hypothetical protein
MPAPPLAPWDAAACLGQLARSRSASVSLAHSLARSRTAASQKRSPRGNWDSLSAGNWGSSVSLQRPLFSLFRAADALSPPDGRCSLLLRSASASHSSSTLHCTVLLCIAPYCAALLWLGAAPLLRCPDAHRSLRSAALAFSAAPHSPRLAQPLCIAPPLCTALHLPSVHCTVLRCTALAQRCSSAAQPRCPSLTALHCTCLHTPRVFNVLASQHLSSSEGLGRGQLPAFPLSH